MADEQAQEQRILLVEADRGIHDLCMLGSLLLVLAIVWRLGARHQGNAPHRRRPLIGNAYFGLVIGIAIGVLAAQIPNFMFSSVESPGASLLKKLKEEQLIPPSCKEVGTKTNHTVTLPTGVDGLPPGIIVPTTDLYMRRLQGKPEEDLPTRPQYLLALYSSYKSATNVDSIVAKFRSKEWSIMLFHEDGKVDDWLEYQWAADTIHVSAQRQSKWWFAKRFLHPDVVASFEYIFLWDADIDVTNFEPKEYLALAKKYGLEISQPAVEPDASTSLTWQMTRRVPAVEVHREANEKPGWCQDNQKPPCAGFVEIQVPVFSRAAWRCAWHIIQNDLVHAWGLDFALGKCAQGPAHERVGVVDAQYIRILAPQLTNPDPAEIMAEKTLAADILERSKYEWEIFKERVAAAEEALRLQVPETQARVIVT